MIDLPTYILQIRRWERRLDLLRDEMKTTTAWQTVRESRERDKAIEKIQEAIAWLWFDLKATSDEIKAAEAAAKAAEEPDAPGEE